MICTRCKKDKDDSLFDYMISNPSLKYKWCIKCDKKHTRKYRKHTCDKLSNKMKWFFIFKYRHTVLKAYNKYKKIKFIYGGLTGYVKYNYILTRSRKQ